MHKGYPEKRNIISTNKSSRSRLIQVYDFYKILDYINFKINRKINRFYHNSFHDKISFPNADVYHFFNGINYGDKPWLSTFETILPRYVYPKKSHKAVEVLARDNCKKLLAFSEFNKNMQLSFLKENFPNHLDSIKDKIEVLYSPQNVNPNCNYDRFKEIDTLKCLFVGHDFFRKGGREVYNVIENMVNEGTQIELTVVSKVTSDNYISQTGKEDEVKWKDKLTSSDFCKYHDSLPNEKVIDLMQNHHVFLFPSFQETFGYVVLEAQSNGLPVVSTAIRALPEINNNECGWLIEVPQNERGFADVFTYSYETISEKIEVGVKNALSDILENKNILIKKSEESVKRIRLNHNPKDYFKRLEEIYLEC